MARGSEAAGLGPQIGTASIYTFMYTYRYIYIYIYAERYVYVHVQEHMNTHSFRFTEWLARRLQVCILVHEILAGLTGLLPGLSDRGSGL